VTQEGVKKPTPSPVWGVPVEYNPLLEGYLLVDIGSKTLVPISCMAFQ
jgi:hypothetical protein